MARSLAFKNVQRALREALGIIDDGTTDLRPGYMRLYPNYKPQLDPGHYGIEVKQSIQTSGSVNEALDVYNFDSAVTTPGPAPILPQKFDIVVPQFNLDPKTINSFYPPDGHADEGRVLPHIVFNDPHLPWDRPLILNPNATRSIVSPDFAAAPGASGDGAATSPLRLHQEATVRPGVPIPPWFALVVFDPSELALTKDDATALNLANFNEASLPSSGAYNMTVGNYLSNIKSRINYDAGYRDESGQADFKLLKLSSDPTSIIFPKKARAKEIFNPSLKFILTSHVREINTVGIPDAGVEEKGLFSVCISHVTGPTTNTKPVTQVVHLVSLEWFDFTRMDVLKPSDRVGMVSLFSWTYLSLPPDPLNFKDTMISLATNKQMLKPSKKTLDSILGDENDLNVKSAATYLHDRLDLGYSIGRWRASTGEETIAFFRGPLTPAPTPWKPSTKDDWPGSSNSGKDFQILDRDLGVMDVTYSSAWQLGKLIAIQDTVFNSALLRFRSLVHKAAASDTRMLVNGMKSSRSIIGNIENIVHGIRDAESNDRSPARNILPTTDKVAPSLSSPAVAPTFRRAVIRAVDSLASAGEKLYNDYNLGAANNSDWEIIHNWISDKLYLSDIPCHYLITDPSHLPSEALRFFYIDDAWLDCFIDGALSVANHLEPVDDKVRRRIKSVYNVHLRNTIHPAPVKPPIPRYGFILRSSLIKVMPDIKITVRCRKLVGPNAYVPDTSREPLIRLTRLDENTIFALLDCVPEEIWSIRLAQPPHQQRFVAAEKLIPTQVHKIRRLFSSGAPAATEFNGEWEVIPDAQLPAGTDLTTWYNPATRCMDILKMGTDLFRILPFNSTGGHFQVATGDSAVFALELNDYSYQMDILPPDHSSIATAPPRDRQLWTGSDAPDPEDSGTRPIINPVVIRPPPTDSQSLGGTPPPQGDTESLLRRLGSLTIHPPSTVPLNIRPQPSLNLSATPILTHLHSAPIPAATAAEAGLGSALDSALTTMSPQYFLTIHPDYRGAPPLPQIRSGADPLFSDKDFIPTSTIHLFDLIFTLQLLNPPTSSIFTLLSLTVLIPTDTAVGPEPLLQGNYAGAGCKLVHNKRLSPLLTTSPSLLQIQLVPRSAKLGEVKGLPMANVADAGFKLIECRIAPSKLTQLVSVSGDSAQVERGVCKVRLVERYLMADGSIQEAGSDVAVLKKEGGDKDGRGKDV
jgi:hypothetical protein